MFINELQIIFIGEAKVEEESKLIVYSHIATYCLDCNICSLRALVLRVPHCKVLKNFARTVRANTGT